MSDAKELQALVAGPQQRRMQAHRMRLASFIVVTALAAPAWSQSLYVGANPLPYALGRISAHVGVAFPAASFEVAAFSAELGDTLPKLIEPDDAGFTERLHGLTAEGYWHFASWDRDALMAGVQVHFDRGIVRRSVSPSESVHFDQIYVLPAIAYRFFPLAGIGVFLKPFAGLGVRSSTGSRSPSVAAPSASFFPLATVLVGYQF